MTGQDVALIEARSHTVSQGTQNGCEAVALGLQEARAQTQRIPEGNARIAANSFAFWPVWVSPGLPHAALNDLQIERSMCPPGRPLFRASLACSMPIC